MKDFSNAIAACGPILCVDTCAVLDVMRDPTRERFDKKQADAAVSLLNAFRLRSAQCFIARQVIREFAEHVDEIQTETERAIDLYVRKLNHIHQLGLAFGGSGEINFGALNELAARSRIVAEEIIGSGVHILDDSEIFASAFQRVCQTKTPAKKGKESTKDCVVVETYLRVVRQLRQSGLSVSIVFVSSNHSDFVDPITKKIADDLADEFEELGVDFAPNLCAAKHLLGI